MPQMGMNHPANVHRLFQSPSLFERFILQRLSGPDSPTKSERLQIETLAGHGEAGISKRVKSAQMSGVESNLLDDTKPVKQLYFERE
jgi:hypothetical protein